MQTTAADDVETNGAVSSSISTMRRFMKVMMSQIFAQSFVLTFLAEWGDRSQISTIILAARDVSLCDRVTKFCALQWKFVDCYLTAECLAVTGGGSVGDCSRLSQRSWILGAL